MVVSCIVFILDFSPFRLSTRLKGSHLFGQDEVEHEATRRMGHSWHCRRYNGGRLLRLHVPGKALQTAMITYSSSFRTTSRRRWRCSAPSALRTCSTSTSPTTSRGCSSGPIAAPVPSSSLVSAQPRSEAVISTFLCIFSAEKLSSSTQDFFLPSLYEQDNFVAR